MSSAHPLQKVLVPWKEAGVAQCLAALYYNPGHFAWPRVGKVCPTHNQDQIPTELAMWGRHIRCGSNEAPDNKEMDISCASEFAP